MSDETEKLLEEMAMAAQHARGSYRSVVQSALRVFVEKHDLRTLNEGQDLPDLILALTNMAQALLELTEPQP